MKYKNTLNLGRKTISLSDKTYFIADIAANHDGDLQRAKDLIFLAKESGIDCAKFQHFRSGSIVSDYGFRNLSKEKLSHQANWKKSVSEIFDQYHTKREWNLELIKTCREADIDFMTTPYDFQAMDGLVEYVNAIKIGSGDITYKPLLKHLSLFNKPILLATGASRLDEVISAVELISSFNNKICLMQCNTNYTGSSDNFNYINLEVLNTYKKIFPNIILGLSDHTPGPSTVLGAIAFGARIIEKHFTDDNSRVGPDHSFAMNPKSFHELIERSRELESALGDGKKRIENNERETVIIQRRSIRLKNDKKMFDIISDEDIEFLRPCPEDALSPMSCDEVIGKRLLKDKLKNDYLTINDVEF